MTRFRQLLCACAVAAVIAAAAASVASAQTFYVNQRGEVGACAKPGKLACLTIKEAIAQAEKTPGPNTIEVEPETGVTTTYKEPIELNSSKDKGLTINGEEPGVIVTAIGKHAVTVGPAAGAVTLSHLRIVTNGATPVRDIGGELTLANDGIEAESANNGIESAAFIGHGSLTILGTEISMESGTTGYAVKAFETPLTMSGVQILTGAAAAAEAGGVYSEKSSLSITNTNVSVVSEGLTPPTPTFGISAGKDSSVALANVRVQQSSSAVGVELEDSPTTANGLTVEMVDPASNVQAVGNQSEAPVAGSSFSHLEVSGTWSGIGMASIAGDLTLSDSRITVNPEHNSPALHYSTLGSGRGLLVQRSVLHAGPSAEPGALRVEEANATLDSSEVLGGKDGVHFEQASGERDALTVAASTVDAGAAGIAADAAGTNGIDAIAKGGPKNAANVSVEGSIVLERQATSVAPGDEANVGCTYSAVPSQSQVAGGGAGAIECAAGASGNTEVNPLSALLAEPFTNYQLSPASSAVNSVPPGAIALPFGLTPSTTDFAGNPRTGDGTDACFANQDKGALELQGHLITCPLPPVKVTPVVTQASKPIAGVLSALTVNPSAFSAAPKGATISRAKTKRKYGAKVSYRDSQAATTTFTVLMPVTGRTQGRSCRKPSKANRHGRRCTLYKALGTFTHADIVGLNSLHFSGRLRGKKLAKGSYRLQAVASNAAGKGAAVSVKFKVK